MAAGTTTISVTTTVRARGVNGPAAAQEVARTLGTALGAAMSASAAQTVRQQPEAAGVD